MYSESSKQNTINRFKDRKGSFIRDFVRIQVSFYFCVMKYFQGTFDGQKI